MRIEESCTQGRYAVATEDIPPGTVVAAGPPTVALLNPDNRCHHLTNSYLHNIYTISTQYLHIISTQEAGGGPLLGVPGPVGGLQAATPLLHLQSGGVLLSSM